MSRILLVDDYPVVRQGLKQILADALPGTTFGEAADAQTAERLVREETWDIIILDVSLPDKSGLDVLKALRQSRPATPILVLSMYSEEQFAVRMIRAGAAGYLNKQAASRDLVGAVQKILSGGRYVSPSLAERLASAVELAPRHEASPHEGLSDREYQVFLLLASGKTVKEIAEMLALSPQTVSTHRTRILEKLGFSTNADLTGYAIQSRLL